MSKHSLLILSGALVIAIPYLGVPASWKMVLEIGVGCLIILTTLALRHEVRTRTHDSNATRSFGGPQDFTEGASDTLRAS